MAQNVFVNQAMKEMTTTNVCQTNSLVAAHQMNPKQQHVLLGHIYNTMGNANGAQTIIIALA